MVTIPDLSSRPRQLVFLCPLSTKLEQFLTQIHQIALFGPAIIEKIDADLDLHAKRKKLLREVDKRFIEGQTADLPRLKIQLKESTLENIALESGRPRTEAYVVYLFLMLRGFNGGCKDQQARLLLEESITLRYWLENLGLELPPASTLSELLNAVSNATRRFIHEVQMQYIFREELDNFEKCFIDSTGVAANTDRPTDSALLCKLVERICRLGQKLHRFGLPDMDGRGLEQHQAELRRLSQQILFLNGKSRCETKRKITYYKLLRRVRRLRKRLLREIEPANKNLRERTDLTPSQRLVAGEVLEIINGDIADLEKAADSCQRRVLQGEKVPMEEKVISTSDPDAAFIVKGGWNSLVGYKVQLARSGGGFVTGLLLPRGNAADSPQLCGMLDEQIRTTGVIPQTVSVDDGYSSQQGQEEVRQRGVKVISIGGAKGKKITSAQLWNHPVYRQARAERSAMESLMFTLKEGYEFGSLMRRGYENVLGEMLEKILGYNAEQILRVRQRKLSEAKEASRAAAA